MDGWEAFYSIPDFFHTNIKQYFFFKYGNILYQFYHPFYYNIVTNSVLGI
jgi:hypothetical protein